MRGRSGPSRPAGFTLIELLVVLAIIGLVSAATLPVVLPALTHRQVGEAARLFQATLAATRDTAIRADALRGIRLLPDPTIVPPGTAYSSLTRWASNRIVMLEPAPNYKEGEVVVMPNTFTGDSATSIPTPPVSPITTMPAVIQVVQYKGILGTWGVTTTPATIPPAPTSWYWNIRIGEKFQFKNSGRTYTIVGPFVAGYGPGSANNPEGFVNNGALNAAGSNYDNPTTVAQEVLWLVDGQDDSAGTNADGYIDNGFDGIDNNGNGAVDYYQGDFNELNETEDRTGLPPVMVPEEYSITRLPVPMLTAREVSLPAGVVIDLTTATALGGGERSRLPINPLTGYVDIMIGPNGQVVPSGSPAENVRARAIPFYHFWLAERDDVFDPKADKAVKYLLPMPAGTTDTAGTTRYEAVSTTTGYNGTVATLKGDRRLVTLFPRTGQVTTTVVPDEQFFLDNPDSPFYPAQMGVRDVQ